MSPRATFRAAKARSSIHCKPPATKNPACARPSPARTGQTPILLIDDVFGELDPVRRQNLLTHLPAESQRLVTTTHLEWLDTSLQGAVFRLDNSKLSAITLSA